MSPYLTVHHPNDPVMPDFDFWTWRLERRAIVNRLRALSEHERENHNAPVAASLEEAANALEREQFGEDHLQIIEGYFRQNWALLQTEPAENKQSIAASSEADVAPSSSGPSAVELPEVDDQLIADMSFRVGEQPEGQLVLSDASVRQLRELLDHLLANKGLGRLPVWDVPILRPTWDKLQWMRPRFVGKVNGVSVRAKLPSTPQEVIPPYELVWLEKQGNGVMTEIGSLELMPTTSTGRRHNPVGQNLSYAPPLWDWLLARRLTVLCLLGKGEWPDPDHQPLILNGLSAPGRPL